MIPKLSPNVADITVFARVCEESGADAISCINTLLGLVVDVESRRPRLAFGTGGLSGPAIRPLAVRMAWQAARAVKIPVIEQYGQQVRIDFDDVADMPEVYLRAFTGHAVDDFPGRAALGVHYVPVNA